MVACGGPAQSSLWGHSCLKKTFLLWEFQGSCLHHHPTLSLSALRDTKLRGKEAAPHSLGNAGDLGEGC